MPKKKKKKLIKLQCQECKRVNYYTKKSQRSTDLQKKLSLKKFCKWCQKHTLHKEKR